MNAAKGNNSEIQIFIVRRAQRSVGKCLLFALAICALVGADLAASEWAFRTLSAEARQVGGRESSHMSCLEKTLTRHEIKRVTVVPRTLDLRFDTNCGMAFGLFETGSVTVFRVVRLMTVIALSCFCAWVFWTGYGTRLFVTGLAAVISGAVGGQVQTFRYGYVVDFISLHAADSFYWPTFNVADALVTMGVAALLFGVKWFVSRTAVSK